MLVTLVTCKFCGWEPVRKSRGRAKIWLDNGIDFNLLETYIKPSSGIFCLDGGFLFSNTLPLNILENEVGYMKRNMAVFKKLRQLVKSQEILQGTNWLLNWIVDTYTTDITMSIRRLVDKHPDPHCNSLYKFLKELETCTSIKINPSELQQDIDQLNGEKNPTLKKLLRFTLRGRAHSDERSIPPDGMIQSRYSDISFDEEAFPEAERIEKLYIKYHRLISGREPNFMEERYVKHTKNMIEDIENTFRRVCKEELRK